jgi:signal transduction histidine kinase
MTPPERARPPRRGTLPTAPREPSALYPGRVQGAWTWLREHPWEADVLLAVLVLLPSLGEAREDPLLAAVSAALAATVVVRRRLPLAAFFAAVAIAALQTGLGMQRGGAYLGAWQPSVADFALAILLYTLAAHTSRRTSVTGLAACLVLAAIAIARWPPADGPHSAAAVLAAVALLASVSITAWVLGDSVAYRYRVAYYAALEERAARLEAERDAQARIAAAAERARELQERRARAVDESAARLRRIERDLHDGAQVRLAALALTLGEIKEEPHLEGDRVRMLISAAHANAKETLTDLRDLARGIHPAVLDRGLDAALSSLADSSVTPAVLTVSVSARPSPAIEAITYFCAAELLANVAKHSRATKVNILVADQEPGLVMTVTDDGVGGARLGPGGGLAGLSERVQTVDGHLGIDSPPGGPTKITIVLPGHA